jgi:alcohol dehydrogenase class IV
MPRFEFATATRIIFGNGTLQEIGTVAAEFGTRALIVVGGTTDRAAPLLDILKNQAVATSIFQVMAEPSIELAMAGVEQARRDQCQMVISFGGGSAIDAGKAIAALVTNPGDVLDYLEVIGKAQPLIHVPLPFIAIPTTAGTGAEVTRNAVLSSTEQRLKVSLRSPLMLARVALVDPELTLNLPPTVTAATGMDALTQVIEPFVSNAANPMTDALCKDAIQRAARSLRPVYLQGDDKVAREDMAWVSLCGGLALANAKLGAVHGFAGVLGGMFPAPHGVICAALLPHVMRVNVRAVRDRDPQNPVLQRFDEIGRWLTYSPSATAADAVEWISETASLLNIPRLAQYGIQPDHFADIIAKAARASSMKGNPIALTEHEMTDILSAAV